MFNFYKDLQYNNVQKGSTSSSTSSSQASSNKSKIEEKEHNIFLENNNSNSGAVQTSYAAMLSGKEVSQIEEEYLDASIGQEKVNLEEEEDKEAEQFTKSLNEETQNALIATLESLLDTAETQFVGMNENKGIIAKGWDWLKNSTGLGTGSEKTQAIINDLKAQVNELKNDKSKLAEVYKAVTGNALTQDELVDLIENNIDFSKSDIASYLGVYQNSQSTTQNTSPSELRESLNKTKEEQGLIGKGWDKFKNATGLGAGSAKAEKAIDDYEKGLISEEEMLKAVEGYQAGQKMSVDVAADMVSGVLAVVAFAAAPFTGGASLLLAAGVGAATKVAIKGGDAFFADREYSLKDAGYDVLTGGVNGLMAPVTNGLGGAAGTGVAKVFGLNATKSAVKAGTRQAIKYAGKEGAEALGKGFFRSILAKQGTEYVLKEGVKSTFKTSLGKILAYGADMMVDGAFSGATDNAVRAIAEGRFEDIPRDTFEGFFGGAIFSPLIGGSLRLGGKAGSTFLHKVNNKITLRNLLPDGTKTFFKQGKSGDCAFLSTFCNMLNDHKLSKVIKKSITTNADGNFNVKIGDKVVTVAREALNDEMLSNSPGVRIFEQAYKQLNGSLDGGFADVVAEQFGLKPIHILGDDITDEVLETLSKNKNGTALSLGIKVNGDGVIDPAGDINHYFSIKNVDVNSKMVTLVDPNDTSKTFSLSFSDLKQQGISIDGGSIKNVDLPNSVRNADDVAFEASKRGKKAPLSKIDTNKSVLEKAGIEAQLSGIENGNYSIDFVATQLALNKIAPEQFVDLVNKKGIANSLQTLAVYQEITTNKLFSPFNLSLDKVDEIVTLLLKDDIYDPNKFIKIIESGIDPSSPSSKLLIEEYTKKFPADKLLDLELSMTKNAVLTTFDPNSVINLGDINGSQKIILAKGLPPSPSQVDLSKILSDPQAIPTLIKSNIITSDIAEFLYGLDEAKLLKLGIFKKVDIDGQSKIVSSEKVSRYVLGELDSEKIDINLSVKDVIDKLHNQGVDSLTSNEIHVLTDIFADLFDGKKKNPYFVSEISKLIKQPDVQSKMKLIYGYIEPLKKLSAQALGPDITIEDHALMRMFDRNLLNVQKTVNGVSEYIDFPTFMAELRNYLTKNPYSFKNGQNDIVIDYLNGVNGLSIIFTKDSNGKIIINSVM